MNESMRQGSYYGETEIDIIKLTLYILRKWRVLLICMLIGAVAGASISMIGATMPEEETLSTTSSEEEFAKVGFLTPEEELDFGTEEEMAEVLGIVTDPAKLTEEVVNIRKVDQYREYLEMYENEIADEKRVGIADSEGNVVIKDSENALKALSLRQTYKFRAIDFKTNNMSDYDIAYYEYMYGDKDKAAEILKSSAKFRIREKKQLTLDSKASSSGGILGQLAEANKNEANPEQNNSANPLKAISLKKTILGALIALFIAVCWYGLKFVLDKSIKDAEDIKRRYKLPILGSISRFQGREGIDGLIDKLDRRNDVVNDREYIAGAIKHIKCKSILLVGDSGDADTADMMNWLSDRDKRCTISEYLTTDKDALAKADECDCIILFVHIWKTKSTDLIHELETATNINKRVAGVVTVE